MHDFVTCRQLSAESPDRLCDRLCDAVVTECLRQDRAARASVSCMGDGDTVLLAGTVSEPCKPDYEALAEKVYGRRPKSLFLMIAPCGRDDGTRSEWEEPCGGSVYGYATNETPELLPVPAAMASRFLQDLMDYKGTLSWGIGRMAEVQVTMDCMRGEVTAFQCRAESSLDGEEITGILDSLMRRSAAAYGVTVPKHAAFVPWDPSQGIGVSGRSAPGDPYGGACRMGGGSALCGHDPSFLGRSGSYMARKIARDIILEGLADSCEVQLAYTAGRRDPVHVNVECFESERMPRSFITDHIRSHYDLTPSGIISSLGLLDVDYGSAAGGGFGDRRFPWEQ